MIKYKKRRERKRNKGRMESENLVIQELDAEEEPEAGRDGKETYADQTETGERSGKAPEKHRESAGKTPEEAAGKTNGKKDMWP